MLMTFINIVNKTEFMSVSRPLLRRLGPYSLKILFLLVLMDSLNSNKKMLISSLNSSMLFSPVHLRVLPNISFSTT
jgi:hypothetical protein